MSSICGLAYNLGAPKKIWYYIALYCMIVCLVSVFEVVRAILGFEAVLLLWIPVIFFTIFTTKEEREKIILDNAGYTVALYGVLVHIELMGWFLSFLCFLGYWTLYLLDGRVTELMEENEKLKKALEQVESTDDVVFVEEPDLSEMEMTMDSEDDEDEEDFDFEVVNFYKDILIA